MIKNTKIKTIELAVPIISNNARWNYISNLNKFKSILNKKDAQLVFDNVCSMAIIDKRRQHLQGQNVDYYKLNQYF